MTTVVSIFTNPIFYAVVFGLLAALYVAWTLARHQYLGIDKLFNVVAMTLATGWVVALITQWIVVRQIPNNFTPADLWVHPTSIIVLVGYVAMAFVATRYILKIRYPYWRTMDMLVVSLATFEAILITGWSLTQIELGSLVAVVSSIISVGILLTVYFKIERHGLATGLHLVLFFGTILSARLLIPSWQETMTGVEWALDISGVMVGSGAVVLRMSAKSEKVLLQDIPRGVSQGFQETFTRAFKNKQPTKKE